MKVYELAAKYMAARKNSNEYSPNTIEQNEYVINSHIIPAIGDMDIAAVTTDTLQSVLDQLSKSESNYSASSVRHVKTLFNMMFKWAADNGYISRNISTCLKVKTIKRKAKRSLNKSELLVLQLALDRLPTRLAHHYGDSRTLSSFKIYSMAIKTMLYSGLQRGEIFALRPMDVDEAGTITVAQQVIYPDNNKGIISPPRSEKTVSVANANPEFAKELAAYAKQAAQNDATYLFCKESGELYTHSDIKRRWQTLMKLCGDIAATSIDPPIEFPSISMENLRYTYDVFFMGLDVDEND